ncbi:MAG TPA: hypothetical protein EYP62_04235 [Kiritimatiellae bacterium]|nr:hypothetical protein [Kiritimatiellia bacterium]
MRRAGDLMPFFFWSWSSPALRAVAGAEGGSSWGGRRWMVQVATACREQPVEALGGARSVEGRGLIVGWLRVAGEHHTL